MGALFPGNFHWQANRSTGFRFLRDALQCPDVTPYFKDEIELLLKLQIDTLALEAVALDTMLDFEQLIKAVIERNTQLNGSDFSDGTYFPFYMNRLNELLTQTRNSIEFLRATQGAAGEHLGEHS